MPRYVPQILIGVAVAFGVSLLIGMIPGAGWRGVFFGGFLGAFTAYILSNLAGNKKVPVASAADRQAALAAAPPEGKALVYLYREGFVAMAAGMDIAVDGRGVAQLKSPRFTRVALAPGPHKVTAAFGGLAGAQSKSGALDLTLAAGQVAVVRIGVSMGLIQGGVTFTPEADTAQAKLKLSGMGMVASDPAEV